MAWDMTGTYVGTCSCALICPCPVDQKPTSPDGTCSGAIVFSIRVGHFDDVELSGINFALYNHWPENLSAGNWTVGVVVDEGASDEQAQALEQILSGQAGGPFEQLAAFITDYRGMERARVTFSDGDMPSATVAGRTQISFEPLRGPDGSPTTVHSAMFGFAPEYRIGKGAGRSEAFGLSHEAVYGESADFQFSSEAPDEVRPRA